MGPAERGGARGRGGHLRQSSGQAEELPSSLVGLVSTTSKMRTRGSAGRRQKEVVSR